MLGVGLIFTAIVLWSCLLAVRLRGGQDHPYIGVAIMGIGGILVLGALLVPLGLWRGRNRLRTRVANAAVDGKVIWRRVVLFLCVTSLCNLVIATRATEEAVHTLESQKFCVSCHEHAPELGAFDQGPHASVGCVDCHVGDGTIGFVKSKLQGTRQLWSVLTKTVKKPIETAIESGRMVPSKETCEQCHWKQQPAAARLKLFHRYAEDAANTPQVTLLTMIVGGTEMGGIHGAHNGSNVEIRFVATDRQRQEIPITEAVDLKTGEKRIYVKKGVDAARFAAEPRITMQCFDCHNRPAHAFEAPDRAVDRSMMLGRMSASLPFLKKTAVEILKKEYASNAAAAAEIPAAVASYYEKSHPDVSRDRAKDVQEAGAAVADIYSHNVFPDLGVTWGTYPNNIGHQQFPGCFRCHDGEHVNASQEALTNNCFRCHFPAAVDEAQPELLKLLGVDRMLKKLQSK
jgi:nitrate/TMAO reductase-like tetraheme cytochrome c subunit